MKRDLRLDGLDLGRVLTGPSTVHLDITNACNTNCVTCWDHSPLLVQARPAEWKRQRVTVASVERLLDDLDRLGGLEAIILSGMGDPLTHPDVDALIAAVKRRGLHLTIITNLIPKDPESLLRLDVDQLLIGIHAASEGAYLAFHPSFRAADWAQLRRSLAVFRAAGRRYKHVHVICKANVRELADMVTLASEFPAAQVNFKLAGLKHGTEHVRIDADDRHWLETVGLPEATRRASELGVSTNLIVFAAQLSAGGPATAPIASVGCFMGQAYSRIAVDGTVLYCCSTEVVVGRLSDAVSFQDLWDGPVWNALRARLRRGEYFASCAQCGKFPQNMKYSERFRSRFGDVRWHAVTGQAAQ